MPNGRQLVKERIRPLSNNDLVKFVAYQLRFEGRGRQNVLGNTLVLIGSGLLIAGAVCLIVVDYGSSLAGSLVVSSMLSVGAATAKASIEGIVTRKDNVAQALHDGT